MKLSYVISALLIATLQNLALAQNDCRPIETRDPRGSIWITVNDIMQPGNYCLTHDIKSPSRSSFAEGGGLSTDGVILRIKVSNVAFDLHGFTMNVEAHGMGGINLEYEPVTPFQRQITIRNGTIRSQTESVITFNDPDGSLASDFAIHKDPKFAEEKLLNILKKLPSSAEGYNKTEHIIERMRLASDGINSSHICPYCKTIGIKGAANIIRNSTIEISDGHAAIYLFGPNQLIENNIIVFKGKAAVESAAAIKLHQGDGSIIRNNDIIIESSGDTAPQAAISLVNSKNVVIEGNRIYGIKTLVRNWDEQSTSSDLGNEFRSMLRRPWSLGEPGVH